MQFHLKIVSTFFKNVCVKDHGDSFSQLLKKKDLISTKIFLYFIDVFWSQFYNEF